MTDDNEKDNILGTQEAEQAIPPAPPSYVSNVVEGAIKDRKEVKETIEQAVNSKEKLLKELAESESWKIFRDEVLLKMLDAMRRNIAPSPTGALDLQAVGMKFVIVDQVTKLVEDAIAVIDNKRKMLDFPEDGDEVE